MYSLIMVCCKGPQASGSRPSRMSRDPFRRLAWILPTKFPPRRPKISPRRPKTPPRPPQDAPRPPQDAPRRPQDAPKNSPDAPRQPQDAYISRLLVYHRSPLTRLWPVIRSIDCIHPLYQCIRWSCRPISRAFFKIASGGTGRRPLQHSMVSNSSCSASNNVAIRTLM